MRVLVACEFSGVVREAFRTLGHDAWSCDLLPSEIPGQHFHADVLAVLRYEMEEWDLMIAHPPCTRLANSGVRWVGERALWLEVERAGLFFKKLLNAPIPRVAIENPIPHRYAINVIGRKYDQIIQPWQFGHGETKATCLWLKGLPLLQPTNIVKGRTARVHHEPPGPDRWKNRSRTFQGIAEAMAEQWGALHSPEPPKEKGA